MLGVLSELVTYEGTSKQTGGAYSLFEVASQAGSGPPPHTQHREDEGLYVLEGAYEFLEEGRITRARIGSLVYVPRDNLHTYKDIGEVPGRMLISQTPGGLHEWFFEEIGEPATDKTNLPVFESPPDSGRIAEIPAKYGIEIPPSPEGMKPDKKEETTDERVGVFGYGRYGLARELGGDPFAQCRS